MIQALVNSNLSYPIKGLKGFCPLCESEVISKCGEINVHHWAHRKSEDCDNWTEPESFWHKSWKAAFPSENREVVIERNGKKHFADIKTETDVVIELQNSPISTEIIQEREDFYGERMLWIINASKYRKRIKLKLNSNENFPFVKKSLSESSIDQFIKPSQDYTYSWEYPLRSWDNTKRPVFIDIGKDFLLWIISGMGTKKGICKAFDKKLFFEKYCGDYSIYRGLTSKPNIENYTFWVNTINELFYQYERLTSKYLIYSSIVIESYDEVTIITELMKVRFEEPVIPNANHHGIFFLFCINSRTNKNSFYIGESFDNKIGDSVQSLILKNEVSQNITLKNKEWIVEYMASVPKSRKDNLNYIEALFRYLKPRLNSHMIDLELKKF